MKPNIVLCYPVLEHHLAWLAQSVPDATIINAGQEHIGERILDADVFVGHAKVPVDWDAVVAQGRLKFIQSSAAGLDHCLVPAVIDSDIIVCSASGLFAKQVAEQMFALLFGLLRSLPVFFHQMQTKEFIRRPTDDLANKRIGIVGLGGNGRCMVPLLKPFGLTINAVDYFPVSKPKGVANLWSPDRLIDLASQSDILILTLPLNKDTSELIDAKVFNAMPRGSYFINVARGGVVNEPDLIAALQSGHLAGAGVDVTAVEPLPESSPLWTLRNVIITPHVGAQAASRVDDSTRLICHNLTNYFAKKPLLNIVDKQLGFPEPAVQAVLNPDWQQAFNP